MLTDTDLFSLTLLAPGILHPILQRQNITRQTPNIKLLKYQTLLFFLHASIYTSISFLALIHPQRLIQFHSPILGIRIITNITSSKPFLTHPIPSHTPYYHPPTRYSSSTALIHIHTYSLSRRHKRYAIISLSLLGRSVITTQPSSPQIIYAPIPPILSRFPSHHTPPSPTFTCPNTPASTQHHQQPLKPTSPDFFHPRRLYLGLLTPIHPPPPHKPA